MKRFTVAVGLCIAMAAPLATLAPAMAAPCRDAKGKFVTCPTVAAAKKPCRDAKGKFIACSAAATATATAPK